MFPSAITKLNGFFAHRDADAPGTHFSSKSLQHQQGLSATNDWTSNPTNWEWAFNLHEQINRSVLFPLGFHTALDLLRSRRAAYP